MAFAQTLLRKMLSDSVPEKHYDIYFVIRNPIPNPVSTSTSPQRSPPAPSPNADRSESDDNHPTEREPEMSEIKLGAHRVVLSAVSEKFEQHTNADNTIVINNCSPSAVREALEIIYGGDLQEARHSVILALDIWKFGVLFDVDHLIALARGSCLNNLSTDNCLKILDFAFKVNDTQIVDKLQNYASENNHFSHVVSSPDLEALQFNVVSSLIRPGKGECAWPEILTFEKVWFDALIRWLIPRVSTPSSHPTQVHPVPLPGDLEVDEQRGYSVEHAPPGYEDVSLQQGQGQEEDDDEDEDDMPYKSKPSSGGNVPPVDLKKDDESVKLVETVLSLVDFSRMKTHELRDVSRNAIACLSPVFSHVLVDILLSKSEKLEATIVERNMDLDVIGQKYQQALCEQDEAERKARAAFDKMDKLQAAKVGLEKRMEEMRRKRMTAVTDSSGAASTTNSARRKMSASSTII